MDDLHDDLTTHVADELTPLSEERLAEIRTIRNGVSVTPRFAIDDLLAEVTRLHEREAALLHLSTVALDNRQRREAALLAGRERLLAVVRAVVSLPPNGSLIEPIYITRETYMQARAALAAAEAGERA